MRRAARAMALRLAMGMLSARSSSRFISSSLRRIATCRASLSSIVIVGLLVLVWEEGLWQLDLANALAKRARHERVRLLFDETRELARDRLGLFVAKRMLDGVASPIGIGGLTRHD